MAEYKKLTHTAEELDATCTHCADTALHVMEAERELWNAAAEMATANEAAIEELPELYQSQTDLVYDANEGLKEITGDFSKYSYLKVALTSSNNYWSYYDINKGLTVVPVVRVTSGSFYLGRINFTSSASKISISDFSGFILSDSGVTATTDLDITIRRVYGVY